LTLAHALLFGKMQVSQGGEKFMNKKRSIVFAWVAATHLVAGCSGTETGNTNANSTSTAATTATRPGPDNSEITTTTDANGVKTETRVFKNNPRIAKIVVTTNQNGTRTVKAYTPSGEEKEVKSSENPLEQSGDAVAGAAGFVADKTVEGTKAGVETGKDAVEKTGATAKAVGDKTVEGTKAVTSKAAETTKSVGTKTVEGAKTVGTKTAEGAKTAADKTGKAIKKVVP